MNKKYEILIEDDVEVRYLLDDILALKKTKKECEIRIVFNKGKLNKKKIYSEKFISLNYNWIGKTIDIWAIR